MIDAGWVRSRTAYSHSALRDLRSWPVVWTAMVAGTATASMSAAPCRKPPAVGLGGSSTSSYGAVGTAYCLYLSSAPGSPGLWLGVGVRVRVRGRVGVSCKG